jgi:hypothetical protein
MLAVVTSEALVRVAAQPEQVEVNAGDVFTIKGQLQVRRSVEIAVASGHNLLTSMSIYLSNRQSTDRSSALPYSGLVPQRENKSCRYASHFIQKAY